MTDSINLIASLDEFDLREAVEVIYDNVENATVLLDVSPDALNTAAIQLRELADLKDAHNAEQARIAAEALAARRAEEARIEALTVAIAETLSPFGTRRSQAEKLLAKFDIAAK